MKTVSATAPRSGIRRILALLAPARLHRGFRDTLPFAPSDSFDDEDGPARRKASLEEVLLQAGVDARTMRMLADGSSPKTITDAMQRRWYTESAMARELSVLQARTDLLAESLDAVPEEDLHRKASTLASELAEWQEAAQHLAARLKFVYGDRDAQTLASHKLHLEAHAAGARAVARLSARTCAAETARPETARPTLSTARPAFGGGR